MSGDKEPGITSPIFEIYKIMGSRLERASRPCDQVRYDASEGVIERGYGGGRIGFIELLALLEKTRSDHLSVLVQDPC